jgi:AraC-like DNA-binding protein
MLKASSHYIVTLLNIADEMGMDVDSLANSIGIDQNLLLDKPLWVDNGSLVKLINALWSESADECMGLTAVPTKMGTSAFVFEYMLAADTLGELYRRGQKACSLLPTAEGIDYRIEKENVIISIPEGYISVRDPKRFLIEFITVIWHRFGCWASDHYIPLKAAFFSYPEPEHVLVYEGLFQCPLSFNQAATGFVFDKKNLSKPIARSKKELADWLLHSPADVLTMPGRDVTMTHQIRMLLSNELRNKSLLPSFAIICKQMSLTAHTVRRRLNEDGSTYQKIKDEVRLELIKEMLANPDYSIKEVSECSGFSELASFTRAVKNWTGMTPAQYRKA